MEDFEVFISEVNELIEAKQYVKLREKLQDLNPADIAALFEYLDAKETILVYRILRYRQSFFLNNKNIYVTIYKI
jgi:Mg/Co/Ni transporter MgtE